MLELWRWLWFVSWLIDSSVNLQWKWSKYPIYNVSCGYYEFQTLQSLQGHHFNKGLKTFQWKVTKLEGTRNKQTHRLKVDFWFPCHYFAHYNTSCTYENTVNVFLLRFKVNSSVFDDSEPCFPKCVRVLKTFEIAWDFNIWYLNIQNETLKSH